MDDGIGEVIVILSSNDLERICTIKGVHSTSGAAIKPLKAGQ